MIPDRVEGEKQPPSFLLHLSLPSDGGDLLISARAGVVICPLASCSLKLLALAMFPFREPGLGVMGTSLPGQVEISKSSKH